MRGVPLQHCKTRWLSTITKYSNRIENAGLVFVSSIETPISESYKFHIFFDFTYGIFIVQARQESLHADGRVEWSNGSIDDLT